MPKGVPNKIYSGQFKVKVVDTMYAEHLSCPEEARRFSIQSETQVARWESIYPEEGKEALLEEQRGRVSGSGLYLPELKGFRVRGHSGVAERDRPAGLLSAGGGQRI